MEYYAKRLNRLVEYVFIAEIKEYVRRGKQPWITQREFDRWCRFGLFGLKVPQYGD